MADRVCTNFIDDDGLDIGCHLVSKEYMLEAYPELVPWMKAPALWAWGASSFGAIGDNATLNRSSPVQTVSAGTNWKTTSSKGNHSAAIKTDGSLWLWGTGTAGRLGNNSIVNVAGPTQTVSATFDWKLVRAGSIHTAAIKTDGTLWTWGNNTNGELGTGDTLSRSSPIQTISGGTNWKGVDATLHTIAIKNDGTLWAWGYNAYGELGNGITAAFVISPVQTVSAGTNWKTVSAGRYHSTAIKTDGTLWTWGFNVNGTLGTNDAINRSSPIQTISGGTNWKHVSAGKYNSAAIKTDGTLWLWGVASSGRLGTENTATKSSPVQTVSSGTNWKCIELGYVHSVAIKTDGSLWVWGENTTGKLGTNNVISRSSPVQTISGGTGWRSIQAGSNFVLAIRDEGEF